MKLLKINNQQLKFWLPFYSIISFTFTWIVAPLVSWSSLILDPWRPEGKKEDRHTVNKLRTSSVLLVLLEYKVPCLFANILWWRFQLVASMASVRHWGTNDTIMKQFKGKKLYWRWQEKKYYAAQWPNFDLSIIDLFQRKYNGVIPFDGGV